MDNFITADHAPTRGMEIIDIPYAEYLIRVTVSAENGVRSLFEENIQILKKQTKGQNSGVYYDVTDTLITKYNHNQKIKPTGDNLMKMMSLVAHAVDK